MADSNKREPMRPGASLRRTAIQSLATAEDRLSGQRNDAKPIAEEPKKKRGVLVHVGRFCIDAMKPIVSFLPKPSSPGASAAWHDRVNLVFMLVAAYLSLDYIFAERTTVWQAALCSAYFVVDLLWLLWDTECVKQPAEILIHHFFALATMATIAVVPWSWNLWPYGLVIEGHTFLIVLQRQMPSPELRLAVRTLMTLTWIPMRIVPAVYPLYAILSGTYYGKVPVFLGILGILEGLGITAMQVVWSYALIKNILNWSKGKKTSED